jgi:hypothetical protein
MYGIGATIGPFLATLYMQVLGSSGLYVHSALVGAAVGAFALYRITQRPAVDDDETEKFTVAPRTSSMAFELDPRSDETDTEPEANEDRDG